IVDLDLGAQALKQRAIHASLVSPAGERALSLKWNDVEVDDTKVKYATQQVGANPVVFQLFRGPGPLSHAYSHYRGGLTLLDDKGKALASSEIWYTTWPNAVELRLGSLYLRPDQKQLLRLNLALPDYDFPYSVFAVKFDLIRRGNG